MEMEVPIVFKNKSYIGFFDQKKKDCKTLACGIDVVWDVYWFQTIPHAHDARF